MCVSLQYLITLKGLLESFWPQLLLGSPKCLLCQQEHWLLCTAHHSLHFSNFTCVIHFSGVFCEISKAMKWKSPSPSQCCFVEGLRCSCILEIPLDVYSQRGTDNARLCWHTVASIWGRGSFIFKEVQFVRKFFFEPHFQLANTGCICLQQDFKLQNVSTRREVVDCRGSGLCHRILTWDANPTRISLDELL